MKTLYASRYTAPAVLIFTTLAGSLALGRFLYELFFPHLLWLGRPFPALLLAATFAALVAWLAQKQPAFSVSLPPHALSPLLLNLLYLFNPTVALVRGRFLFVASLWLTAAFLVHQLGWLRRRWMTIFFIVAALLPIYLLTMPHTVGRADTFEFQVVAPQLGIAHPTGYPLYLLSGKLFTLLPVGSVAWRLNLASAVYGLAAAILIHLIGCRLYKQPLPALLSAVVLGLTPVFWSQAIEAEVYTLHALIVAVALWLMVAIGDWRPETKRNPPLPWLAFVIGLGLTNHLTTVFLLPPVAMLLFFAYRDTLQASTLNRNTLPSSPFSLLPSLFKSLLAFLLPLTLYAYLPLRWLAVTGEPMGFGRFIDWVIGGRFQGALQWGAWLDDPARYGIVGRLLLDNWGGALNLLIILAGFVYLAARRWRVALILLTTWLGYVFYALNYYVPDLAVFLMPAHVVMAVWWGVGIVNCQSLIVKGQWSIDGRSARADLLLLLLVAPTLLLAARHWPQVDRSQDDGRTQWGLGVLTMPLARDAAILADSEKIAPLYYLQQAEGMRPDLEIMVLPDEAAYRAELDTRLAAGQTVYLARFLPGLAGIYHLRSVGPLTEVSTQPLTTLPATVTTASQSFGAIRLLGYQVETAAAVAPARTAVTLYWQATEPVNLPLAVYVRWAEGRPVVPTGQHPANNSYPTVAWQPDEIVPDYHLLPHPISHTAQRLDLQVALAPPFTAAAELDWQTVTEVDLPPTQGVILARPLRQQIGAVALTGVDFPGQLRPQTPLPLVVAGYGDPAGLRFGLRPVGAVFSVQCSVFNVRCSVFGDQFSVFSFQSSGAEFVEARELRVEGESGRYEIVAQGDEEGAVCGWLAPVTAGCVVGEVEISGVPLPAEAHNFDDKIALLAVDIPDRTLTPGGQLRLTLTWQGLAPLDRDYTVFVQVVDAADRLVGQVDSWPVQGTHPTSQWRPGEMITDSYVVQLDGNLPPGPYRLLVGWYLLADLRRLPLLNEDGAPVDDKVVIPGLVAP